MKPTLFKYILKMQFLSMISISIFVFLIILLFDFAEASRKFPIENIADIGFALKISFLRTPSTFFEILHYIYFITATINLWNLCTSHQLTIIKAIGGSPQQILFPYFAFAIATGMFWLLIANPLSMECDKAYKEAIGSSETAFTNGNIWLDYKDSHKIIYISKIKNATTDSCFSTGNVVIITEKDKIMAESASVHGDQWQLKNISIVNKEVADFCESKIMSFNVSRDLIRVLILPAGGHTIYTLYDVYVVSEDNKVDLRTYKIALHKLLAHCFIFIVFALIAAVLCFPINRYKTKTNIAVKVIFISIIIKFAMHTFEAFASSGVLSVALACWSAPVFAFLLAFSLLIWREV